MCLSAFFPLACLVVHGARNNLRQLFSRCWGLHRDPRRGPSSRLRYKRTIALMGDFKFDNRKILGYSVLSPSVSGSPVRKVLGIFWFLTWLASGTYVSAWLVMRHPKLSELLLPVLIFGWCAFLFFGHHLIDRILKKLSKAP